MRYRPSELKAFLTAERSLLPKKRLSQNFLIDGNIIRKIIRLADISSQDCILEIGSGPGALTQALLQTGANVIAVEMDPNFAKSLQEFQTEDKRLQVFKEDFLKFDLNKIFYACPQKIKVVANLPYHITTPILAKLLPLNAHINSLTVMVQKEVALRFLTKPGSKNWNSFSLFLRFYSQPFFGFKVAPTCFYPRPKVESAVVKLSLKIPPSLSSEEDFFTMTRTAFGQRRKMLKVSLKKLYPVDKIEEALCQLGKKNTLRPEQLSLDEFIAFFEKIYTGSS